MPDETPQPPPPPIFTEDDIRAMIERAKTIQYGQEELDWMESNVEYPSQVPPPDVVEDLNKARATTNAPPTTTTPITPEETEALWARLANAKLPESFHDWEMNNVESPGPTPRIPIPGADETTTDPTNTQPFDPPSSKLPPGTEPG